MDVDSNISGPDWIFNISLDDVDFKPEFLQAYEDGAPAQLVCDLGAEFILEGTCASLNTNAVIVICAYLVFALVLRVLWARGPLSTDTMIKLFQMYLTGVIASGIAIVCYYVILNWAW